MIRFTLRFSALLGAGALMLGTTISGCMSYSYQGIANTERLPDKSVIGMRYGDVVARFGAPSRVVRAPGKSGPPVAPASAQMTPTQSTPDGQGNIRKGKKGSVLLVYRHSRRYVVLLYERVRAFTYTMTLTDGRVSAFSAVPSGKSDGLSLSSLTGGGSGLVAPGGAGGSPGGPGGGGR